ncbi:MAG: DUF4824 family protein [Pseudomonadaceae bacterium]|nr:DUF4824 family protein [Pseudomonadaceae bacterium]
MNWTHRHNLLAGLGLILLVNAIALAGVAWNRSEPTDSRLQLSERELGDSYEYWRKENSGVALRLDYRWPDSQSNDYSDRGSNRLSPAKMAELGFSVPTELNEESMRRYRRQLDRDGLLVLEFNGPLYQQQLQRAQEQLTKSSADLAALPSNKDLQGTYQDAREALQREQTSASRLFIIDAGTDQASLRAKYPDRQQYAIVRGQISAWSWRDDDHWQLGGSAQLPVAASINLPKRWHQLFDSLPVRKGDAEFPHSGGDKLFNAELAFGQRLEPWVVQLQAGQP